MFRTLIFITAAILAIGACSKGGSRIKVDKTLVSDQDSSGTATELDRKLTKATELGECLNIYEVSKQLLAAENDVFSTYTSAVGIGVSNEDTHKSFNFSEDPYLITQALKGIPPAHEALLGSELSKGTIGILLNISEQKECQSVTFLDAKNNPIELRVIASDKKTLILKDSTSNVVLRYSKPSNGQFKILIYKPKEMNDCSNTKQNLVLRVEHKITWGGSLEYVQLDETYAKFISEALKPNVIQELNDAISASVANSEQEKSGKPTDRPEYIKRSFEISYPTYAKIQDLIKNSDLSGSTCKKP